MIRGKTFSIGQKVLLFNSRLRLFPVSYVLSGLDRLLSLMSRLQGEDQSFP